MHYLKQLISVLVSMNFYSTSNDLLSDHSCPSYLQFVSEDSNK
ncbi:hypothetical protein JCM19232_582 [Vibrio ishigakensis]|uniref:Uncharacterized protein n=1 Tax=Vibrio ishigakensis TaxID=1481914 RepID=A0A0B8PBF6_9VIBR|nr:hypothetical protein JCM19232_582 [Vibrio ishigakensis]GAM66484.1 hypothetical protein JCM19236_3936 [Vibrio sp. JCM 19236]